MSSSYSIQNGNCSNANFASLKLPENTKGKTYVNDGTNVKFLTVGTDGQFFTANSAASLGVEWANKPTGVASNSNQIIVGSIVIPSTAAATPQTVYYILKAKIIEAQESRQFAKIQKILTHTNKNQKTLDSEILQNHDSIEPLKAQKITGNHERKTLMRETPMISKNEQNAVKHHDKPKES